MGTVDGILRSFNRTVSKLERLSERKQKEGVKVAEKILDLRDKRDACYEEAGRATKIAGKIRAMVSG